MSLTFPWPWYLGATRDFPPELPDNFDVSDAATALAALVEDPAWALPVPGCGRTMDRFVALAEVSALDLSLGRLFEGHTDAVAILSEAGRPALKGAVMGVWAARRNNAHVAAIPRREGWHLQGCKPWASGAGRLTHALVTAATGDGDALFEVALTEPGVRVVPGTWPAVGMAGSESSDVEFDVAVSHDQLVGAPGWYVERPGFWFGSAGVAACWLGGAVGLVRALQEDLSAGRPDAHQLAHVGASVARCSSMARDVAWAAGRIDADPSDPERAMAPVSREVRHLVEEGCLEIVTRVGRAGGAGPLCRDPAQARRGADLPVYIRQHHADRDAEALGRVYLAPRAEA